MEREQYEAGMGLLLGLARTIQIVPVEDMLRELERADTMGPFVDPTLWREAEASGRLADARDLLRSAATFKAAAVKLAAKGKEPSDAGKASRIPGGL